MSLQILEKTSKHCLKIDFNYTSRMTTLLHVWRDVNRKVIKQIPHDKSVKMMPPRLVGGRWGSISDCEKYVVAASEEAREALCAVLGSLARRQ